MRNLFIVKWLRNIPITRKLYFTVGLMAMLIAVELFTLQFAIRTLSSVRALVGAEGLWSKAQKDAAYSLQKYGRTHNEKDYQAYLNYLRVPMGDRKARLEMFKAHPDMAIVREGFIEGRFHPNDIEGPFEVLRRFHDVSYINKAIRLWSRGDTLITSFMSVGERLHVEVVSGTASAESINAILQELDPLNEELTQLEDEFSFTLGEGSRWLADFILKLLLTLVLTVEICGLTITIFVSRGISLGLNEIIRSARRIATGDYTARAKIYSQDEIGVLAGSFNDMAAKLEHNINALRKSKQELRASKELAEQSVVVKTNFLTNMSHEIRTPMNAVIGFTNLLEHTNLDERQQEFVRAIKISGQNLMTIINDILDYSKIESGKIIIEQVPFNVRDIFSSLQVLLHPKIAATKLQIRFHVDEPIPLKLIGDPTRLMQVLLNLSDNAIKFTENGHVNISAVIQDRTDKEVKLKFIVEDTGKGIPPEKLSVIFERFTQESAATTRRYGGTGLGLSIAKNLVELQNGKIEVKSTVGKGSQFSFILSYPVADSNTPDSPVTIKQADNTVASPARPLHILLAEDNKVNQSLAVHVLKKFGFSADIADNGKIAVEKIQQKQYDLVLMDMQMPEMDGYEATTIIRKELKSNIPIIALTAHVLQEEREKCLALGMNEYVAKPFDPKELYNKIILCAGQNA